MLCHVCGKGYSIRHGKALPETRVLRVSGPRGTVAHKPYDNVELKPYSKI